MAKLTGTHITIIIGLVLAAIVALAVFRQDTSALVAILGALIATGLGTAIAQNNEIRTKVNGNLDNLTRAFEAMANRAVDAAREAPPKVRNTDRT